MNEKQKHDLVQDFLNDVEEKLPEWLKCDKDELQDTLDQLEEHVWDKATEISSTGMSMEKSLSIAISEMGSPSSIAREYKRRGTPKYYISEELWPLYKKVLIVVISIGFFIELISLIINLILGTLEDYAFTPLYYVAIGFSIVTIVFIALSMEGYFPEDFKTYMEIERKERAIQKGKDLGLPISPKTGKQLKPFIKPGEKIAGGIFSILIGILFIIQPYINLEPYFHEQFLMLIRFWGLIAVGNGILNLIRGVIGNAKPQSHQIIFGLLIGLKIISSMLFVALILNPGIIPTINFESDPPIIALRPGYYDIYRVIVVVIMALSLLSIIEEIYWMVNLENYKI